MSQKKSLHKTKKNNLDSIHFATNLYENAAFDNVDDIYLDSIHMSKNRHQNKDQKGTINLKPWKNIPEEYKILTKFTESDLTSNPKYQPISEEFKIPTKIHASNTPEEYKIPTKFTKSDVTSNTKYQSSSKTQKRRITN